MSLITHPDASSVATDQGTVEPVGTTAEGHSIFDVAEDVAAWLVRVAGFARHNGPVPTDDDDNGEQDAPKPTPPGQKAETAAGRRKREAKEKADAAAADADAAEAERAKAHEEAEKALAESKPAADGK